MEVNIFFKEKVTILLRIICYMDKAVCGKDAIIYTAA